jgi:hypothetical protein
MHTLSMQRGRHGFVGAQIATQVAAGLGGQPRPLSQAAPATSQGQPRGSHLPSTQALTQGFDPSGQTAAQEAAGLLGQSSARAQVRRIMGHAPADRSLTERYMNPGHDMLTKFSRDLAAHLTGAKPGIQTGVKPGFSDPTDQSQVVPITEPFRSTN